MKPTLHLLHGLPGSGKTTYARRLERERGAVRFTPDEWMIALHGTNPPEAVFRPQAARIMELIWENAARVLATGVDVVLDAGLWSRGARDDARRRARELGVACRFYVLSGAVAEARRRVLARTAAMPAGALEITGPTFDFLAAQVEPFGPDEEHEVIEWAAASSLPDGQRS